MANPTPETAITANQILSLVGAITGPIGVVISLLVYFRDRAKVRVVLAFDMQGFGGLTQVPDKYFAVRIFNIGRRPIYLDLAHIVFPKWARRQIGVTHFLLSSGVQGVKIAEGDPLLAIRYAAFVALASRSDVEVGWGLPTYCSWDPRSSVCVVSVMDKPKASTFSARLNQLGTNGQ
jgi:hypothetical protein